MMDDYERYIEGTETRRCCLRVLEEDVLDQAAVPPSGADRSSAHLLARLFVASLPQDGAKHLQWQPSKHGIMEA